MIKKSGRRVCTTLQHDRDRHGRQDLSATFCCPKAAPRWQRCDGVGAVMRHGIVKELVGATSDHGATTR